MTQERDLLGSVSGERLDLLNDVVGWTGPLPAPRNWDDAIGAELIASVLNGHERLQFLGPTQVPLRDVLHHATLSVGQVDALRKTTGLGRLLDEARQLTEVAGAEHEIDVGGTATDFIGPSLSHAAANAKDHVLLCRAERRELPEERKGLIFRFLSDRAGVKNHHLGFENRASPREAKVFKVQRHLFAVLFVHLASPRLDVIGPSPGPRDFGERDVSDGGNREHRNVQDTFRS